MAGRAVTTPPRTYCGFPVRTFWDGLLLGLAGPVPWLVSRYGRRFAKSPAIDCAMFYCEGCGSHVSSFGITRPPPHGFCAVCAWLNENIPDPEEMMEAYKWHQQTGR